MSAIIIMIFILCVLYPPLGLPIGIIYSGYHIIKAKPSSFPAAKAVSPTKNRLSEDADDDFYGEPDFTTYKDMIERGLANHKWNDTVINSIEWKEETRKLQDEVNQRRKDSDDRMKIQELQEELDKLKKQKYKSVEELV